MKSTIYELQRFADALDYTYGILREHCAQYPLAFTLEDQAQLKKVHGETRIPQGTYEIKLREVLSGLTKKYRAKYDWFTWHLELQDVPEFDYVYIHIGNNDDHTDACILVGNTCDLTAGKNGFIGESTDAFKDFYLTVRPKLEAGERVFIHIFDQSV